jgi:hypothetical protein
VVVHGGNVSRVSASGDVLASESLYGEPDAASKGDPSYAAMSLSPDGDLIVGSPDRGVATAGTLSQLSPARVQPMTNASPVPDTHPWRSQSVDFNPLTGDFACAGPDGVSFVSSSSASAIRRSLSGEPVDAVRFSNDYGVLFALATYEPTVHVIDLASRSETSFGLSGVSDFPGLSTSV